MAWFPHAEILKKVEHQDADEKDSTAHIDFAHQRARCGDEVRFRTGMTTHLYRPRDETRRFHGHKKPQARKINYHFFIPNKHTINEGRMLKTENGV
jgi:hypothetical protein